MERLGRTSRRSATVGAAIGLALAASVIPGAVAYADSSTSSIVSSTIGTTNVTPMWGPQLPKIVNDGQWYYTVTMDGSGASYPWIARIWKSQTGTSWSLVKTLNQYVYQPPAVVVDSGNRVHLIVPCYTGGQCYPGVTPASGAFEERVYPVHLRFDTRLADGSLSFDSWTDYSVRSAGSERYYGGVSIDRDRRYIYHAFSDSGWNLRVSRFDSWTGTETLATVGVPGANEAYLYPRVRPGTSAGEVWLLFNQTVLNTGSSSTIYGVQLWRSTDYGATFPQRFMVAYCPNPDGVSNWCDASDLAIDSSDVPHVLYYKHTAGTPNLYYWKGSAGSVTLSGSPTNLGSYDNHSQLSLYGSRPRVFAHATGASATSLVTIRNDGSGWVTAAWPIAGLARVYSPNLLRPESGSFTSLGTDKHQMLVSGIPTAGSTYSRLDVFNYQG